MSFGLTHNNEEEAVIRKTMLQNAKKRYVLIDSTKFGRGKTHGITAIDDIDAVFTDSLPDERWLNFFEKHDVELRVCE